MEVEKADVSEENVLQEERCESSSASPSPIEDISWHFLKCIPKEKVFEDDSVCGAVETIANNEDASQNGEINLDECFGNSACAFNNEADTNQIFAKLNEKGLWIVSWDISSRQENDFIGLSYLGMYDPYVRKSLVVLIWLRLLKQKRIALNTRFSFF